MAVYSVLLSVGLVASAPWWLLRMATTARYREGLRERLGRVPPALRASVRNRQVVWVHAVSVGEVLAVARLITELQAALPADAAWRIVVSTTTRTGHALARERFGANRVFYLPFDFRWAVQPYLEALKPSLVLLAESELWPRLLHECRREAIPVAVVNARVSDRSFRRARRVRALWQPVLRNITLFLAQSRTDAERLRSLGAEASAVLNVGNLKYDAREPLPGLLVEHLRTLCQGRPVLVAGSTVEGEDELVLSAFAEIRQAIPDALLILAPRHPERFKAVAALAEDFGALHASSLLQDLQGENTELQRGNTEPDSAVPLLPQTPVADAQTPAQGEPAPDFSVVVLDTIGDLASVYGLADVVFIGGTLVPRGGHNPLEPARFGVPVMIGPSFENFREVVAAMKAADGILIVKDEEEFTSAIIDLLTNSPQAHSLGERGRSVFAHEGGATARSIQALMPLLATSDPFRHPGLHAGAVSREASA